MRLCPLGMSSVADREKYAPPPPVLPCWTWSFCIKGCRINRGEPYILASDGVAWLTARTTPLPHVLPCWTWSFCVRNKSMRSPTSPTVHQRVTHLLTVNALCNLLLQRRNLIVHVPGQQLSRFGCTNHVDKINYKADLPEITYACTGRRRFALLFSCFFWN